jgi:site-specific recombinase XerD
MLHLVTYQLVPIGHAEAALQSADDRLNDSTIRRIVEATPASTRRAYGDDWAKRFVPWCADNDRDPLPASPQAIADYLDHLCGEGKAPSTLERALSSILSAHSSAGHSRPDLKLAREVIRAYRRERADAGIGLRKAEPVTTDGLKAMTATLDLDSPKGLRDRALILLGFALGSRRSEVAAFDLGDLKKVAKGYDVTIRKSKTDRNSIGRTVGVHYGKHPETCPVRCLNAWLAARGAALGPLFLRVDQHGNIGAGVAGSSARDGRLTGQAVAIVVNRTALAAGLDATTAWSGHSLRRGFATETYRTGAAPLRIARRGGWKDGSKTLLGYIEDVDRWADNPLANVDI